MRALCRNNLKKIKLCMRQFGSKHIVLRIVNYSCEWITTKYKDKSRKAEVYRKILNEVVDGNFLNSIIVIKTYIHGIIL